MLMLSIEEGRPTEFPREGQLVSNRSEDRQEVQGNSLLIMANGTAILAMKEVDGLNETAEEKAEEAMEPSAFLKWSRVHRIQ